MIAHSIGQAKAASSITRVVVSTDCPSIAEVAREYGAEVPFLRPDHLATDEAGSVEVILHAADALGTDEVALLQPTSPLRRAFHIDEAVALFRERQADSVISCTIAHPLEWHYRENPDGSMVQAVPAGMPTRRQDASRTLLPNGAVYVLNVPRLRVLQRCLMDHSFAYLMSRNASLDIDTLEDFLLVEAMLTSGILA